MTVFSPDLPLSTLNDHSTRRRYSPGALLPTTLKLAAQYHKHMLTSPAEYTPAAFLRAERAVNLASKRLSAGLPTTKQAQRKREAALFYALARRDALRLVLREIDPGSVPATGSLLAKRQAPGAAAKRARCRYHLKLQRAAEPSLTLDYQQARAAAVETQVRVDRAKAELYLALDDLEQTLLQRRIERGDKARRPRGSAALVETLREHLKHAQQEHKRREHDARLLRGRLTRCRARIAMLVAELSTVE